VVIYELVGLREASPARSPSCAFTNHAGRWGGNCGSWGKGLRCYG